jgi:hypothetical protein
MEYKPYCPFCRLSPCFMAWDDNYENLLVLGTEMKAKNKNIDEIQTALYFEMLHHFHDGIMKNDWCMSLPYCITQEICDAYPHLRNKNHSKKRS